MTTAFVIGNGTSRLDIDLTLLKKWGKTYGCNRLYQDFAPDVLVATDPGISLEIQDSKYSLEHIFYTRKPFGRTGARKIELNFGFSSGPIATSYAIQDKHDTIYLLGFDFAGHAKKFNNVYADTPHYKKTGEKETFYGNWVNQFITIIKQAKNVKFVRVIKEGIMKPKQFEQLTNLTHMEMVNFLESINS